MTERVDQPSQNPTRKLSAAILGMSVAAMVKAVVTNRWPYLGDPAIWEPFPIVCGALCGYFIKDRDNSGLSPLAKEVGQTVDAELPAGEAVEIVTPPGEPNIVVRP